MVRRLLSTPALLAAVAAIAACGATAGPPGPTSPATAPPTASTPPVTTRAASPTASALPATTPAASPTASTPPVATVAARPARPAPSRVPSVAVRTAAGYGRLLVDGAGRTLYLFTADHGRTSSCTGPCAVAWPPLIVKGGASAGPGLRGGRLSLVVRAGGQVQLAYYGHPLYYYVGDRQAGQINCQDAEEYGGHWWLVGPDGQQNRSTPG